jgi:UDP-glucose 4-epimerase
LRDYVHVGDIADAHVAALKRLDAPGFQVYNIGTGLSHSVREILFHAERATGQKIRARDSGRRAGDPAILCADPTRLKEKLGWQPTRSKLEDILEGAWEWEKTLCAQTRKNVEVGGR